MYFLYILKNQQRRHYIGITGNVEMRLYKHNSGSVRSTKAYRPWILVRKESFHDKTSARKRELFLKKNALVRKQLFEEIDDPIV